MSAHPKGSDPKESESGIGLIEVMVSMFIVALVAVSLAPVLVNALQTSVRNGKIATANQLAAGELDLLREIAPHCDALAAFGAAAVPPVTDERGTQFQAYREVGACPATFPATISVRVWSKDVSSGDVMADARTLFYVESAATP